MSIDKMFEKYFQKKICIKIGDEVIKEGNFLLFRNMLLHQNFFYELHIRRKEKIDILKLPYPFEMEEHVEDQLIYFDYRLHKLLKTCDIPKELLEKLLTDFPEPHRMYNNIVEIQFT